MSFDPNELDGADDAVREWAREMALIRRRCGWCERELRPCNMARHVAAAHFRQLTIDDVIEDVQTQAREALDALPADATVRDAAEALRPVGIRAIEARPTCPATGESCRAQPACDRDERAICESAAKR